MARAFEGEFVLSDRSSTGKLNVYVVEKDPETDEPQFTGWADIPTGKAKRLVAGGRAELHLNDGRRIPVVIGKVKPHSGSPLSTVTFSRRQQA